VEFSQPTETLKFFDKDTFGLRPTGKLGYRHI